MLYSPNFKRASLGSFAAGLLTAVVATAPFVASVNAQNSPPPIRVVGYGQTAVPTPAPTSTSAPIPARAPVAKPVTFQQVELIPVRAPMVQQIVPPQPLRVPVPTPFPVDRFQNQPVPVPFPVDRFQNQPVPVPFPVDRVQNQPVPVPFPVERTRNVPVPVPFPVERTRNVPVPVPFPVDRVREVRVPAPYPVATPTASVATGKRRIVNNNYNTITVHVGGANAQTGKATGKGGYPMWAYARARVNVRACPTLMCGIKDTLAKGTPLLLSTCNDKWCRTTINQQPVFVSRKYVGVQ